MGRLSQRYVKKLLYLTHSLRINVINNNSTLPPFEYKANSKFDNISFTEHEIISIIRSLNHNKAHGWDAISIRMIKMCDESIVFPLKLIFESALKFGVCVLRFFFLFECVNVIFVLPNKKKIKKRLSIEVENGVAIFSASFCWENSELNHCLTEFSNITCRISLVSRKIFFIYKQLYK